MKGPRCYTLPIALDILTVVAWAALSLLKAKENLSFITFRRYAFERNDLKYELSYILSEFFNMYLKEFCFPVIYKFSSVIPVFKNVGERCTAENYRPVSLLSVVSKIFEIIGFLIGSRNVAYFWFFRTITGIQSGQDFSVESRSVITFLTNLGNNFALSEAEDNT